ncbi:MAG: hypothetical protein ACRETA_03250 [Gammaproteobacteria bacterium]
MDNQEQRERDSEIDMVDVWIIIRGHAWLFIAVFLVLFILGVVVATLRSTKYDYSVTVQIGGFRSAGTGKLEPLVQLDAVVDALQNAIIPEVLQTYADAHTGFNPATTKILVTTPKTGAQVTLQTRGTLAQGAFMREILSKVVQRMDRDQGSLLQERIAATKALLAQQIAKLESDQTALEKSQRELLAHGTAADKAMTVLLIDDQIATQQQQLLALKQQLNVDLPTAVQLTQPITPPQRSTRPSGLGTMAFVALAFILSVFLGLFAVFIAHIRNLATTRTPPVA